MTCNLSTKLNAGSVKILFVYFYKTEALPDNMFRALVSSDLP